MPTPISGRTTRCILLVEREGDGVVVKKRYVIWRATKNTKLNNIMTDLIETLIVNPMRHPTLLPLLAPQPHFPYVGRAVDVTQWNFRRPLLHTAWGSSAWVSPHHLLLHVYSIYELTSYVPELNNMVWCSGNKKTWLERIIEDEEGGRGHVVVWLGREAERGLWYGLASAITTSRKHRETWQEHYFSTSSTFVQ